MFRGGSSLLRPAKATPGTGIWNARLYSNNGDFYDTLGIPYMASVRNYGRWTGLAGLGVGMSILLVSKVPWGVTDVRGTPVELTISEIATGKGLQPTKYGKFRAKLDPEHSVART